CHSGAALCGCHECRSAVMASPDARLSARVLRKDERSVIYLTFARGSSVSRHIPPGGDLRPLAQSGGIGRRETEFLDRVSRLPRELRSAVPVSRGRSGDPWIGGPRFPGS